MRHAALLLVLFAACAPLPAPRDAAGPDVVRVDSRVGGETVADVAAAADAERDAATPPDEPIDEPIDEPRNVDAADVRPDTVDAFAFDGRLDVDARADASDAVVRIDATDVRSPDVITIPADARPSIYLVPPYTDTRIRTWISASSVTTSGALVESATDLSGHGVTMVKQADATRPTLVSSSVIAGRPAFSLGQGTPSLLVSNAAISLAGYTYFFEMYSNLAAGGEGLLVEHGVAANVNPGNWMNCRIGAGCDLRTTRSVPPNTTSGPIVSNAWSNENTKMCVAVRWDPTTGLYRMRYNTVWITLGSGVTLPTAPTSQTLHFGARSGGGFPWSGFVRQMGVANDAYTDQQMIDVVNWMRIDAGLVPAFMHGNSIGAGVDATTFNNTVWGIISNTLGFGSTLTTSRDARNLSFSGSRTPQLTAEFNTVAAPYAIPGEDNVVFMLEIGNDIQLNGATAQQAYDHVVQYVAKARSAGFRRVFVFTVTPRGAAAGGPINAGFEATRNAVNAMLLASNGAAGIIIDVTGYPVSNWANAATYIPDGTHPSNLGHANLGAAALATYAANP